MKIGFLYAGQGSQHIGMGQAFYEQVPAYRALVDGAPVDFNMSEICYHGSEEVLAQTQITQPCMTTMAVGITDILRTAGVVPVAAAGLSLGEYGALYCAGVLDAQTVIALTAFRGEQMTAAAQGIDCGMYAILGVERDILTEWCENVAEIGVAQVANCNCAGQIVISGEKNAVEAVASRAKENGKRAMPLKVSGPFHTSIMKSAGDALAQRFGAVNFNPMQTPVAFNCTGAFLQQGEEIPALLEQQVQSTVYFEDCVRAMLDMGVDTFVEIGAGKVLAGFLKRIDRTVKVFPMATPEDLSALLDAIKEV